MSIQVSGKHIELGESLQNYINESLHNLIEKYIGEKHEAYVVVSKEGHFFKTEIKIHINHHFSVHCIGHNDDAYKSASSALEKLEARAKRYKTKLHNRKRYLSHENVAEQVQKFVIKPQEEDTAEDNPLIIAEMASEVRTMSVSEAVMRMDLSEMPVIIFRNAASGEINVCYRRQDGHIGWIDPSKKLA